MDAAKKKKGFLKPSTRENFCIYWYNFRSNKLSMVGLAIVVISLIFAILPRMWRRFRNMPAPMWIWPMPAWHLTPRFGSGRM